MPKVYLVSSGSYSDYSVAGVFSTKENAAEFMARVGEDGHSDWNGVQEVEIDAALPQLRAGLKPWFVQMERDGTALRIEEKDLSASVASGEIDAHVWERSKAPAYRGLGMSDLLNANVFASSAEHAVKIVNEYRTQMIASGKYPSPARQSA